MTAIKKRFKKHKGVQIWEVTDGRDVSYKSDPIEDVVFASDVIGDVQAQISICNLFGCIKSPARSKKPALRARPACSK